MKKVVLRFQTVKELWDFKMTVNPIQLEIRGKEHCLVCECTNAEIELAEAKFHAKVIQLMSASS